MKLNEVEKFVKTKSVRANLKQKENKKKLVAVKFVPSKPEMYTHL